MKESLNFLEQFGETWSFSNKEWETFERLKREFEMDRHLENRPKARTSKVEVGYAILHIQELIQKEIDTATRSFLFRIALFLEDRLLIARGMARLAEQDTPSEPIPKSEKIIFCLIIISAILYLTFIFPDLITHQFSR